MDQSRDRPGTTSKRLSRLLDRHAQEETRDHRFALTVRQYLKRPPHRNRLGDVDTMRRLIYIHGCPADTVLGTPGSHGCIRMRNPDVVKLFDHVPTGTAVTIR